MNRLTKAALYAAAAVCATNAQAAVFTVNGSTSGLTNEIRFAKIADAAVINSVTYQVEYETSLAYNTGAYGPYEYSGYIGSVDFGSISFAGTGTANGSTFAVGGKGTASGSVTAALGRFAGTGDFTSQFVGDTKLTGITAIPTRGGGTVARYVISIDYTPVVPEPATWAMMLVGFGLIGGATRYRRKNTAIRYA